MEVWRGGEIKKERKREGERDREREREVYWKPFGGDWLDSQVDSPRKLQLREPQLAVAQCSLGGTETLKTLYVLASLSGAGLAFISCTCPPKFKRQEQPKEPRGAGRTGS
jgi:hypothetical protein